MSYFILSIEDHKCVYICLDLQGIHLVKSFALPFKKSVVIPYFIWNPSCIDFKTSLQGSLLCDLRADGESICHNSSDTKGKKGKAGCNSFSTVIIGEFTVSTLDQMI